MLIILASLPIILCGYLIAQSGIINDLRSVNRKLWEVEDLLRVCEKQKCFDEGFITLARSVYKTNNERFELKTEINTITSSHLIEEKIHP